MAKSKERGLGRGLNALFDDDEEGFGAIAVEPASGEASSKGASIQLGVEQLSPSDAQPRFDFDPEALNELAESIKQHGIVQPLLVRPKKAVDDAYEIIAGERRWRAAQIAQLHDVPVIIRDFDDVQAMQIALIENLQREDLNPVEEALGYQRLMNEHDYTQANLALALGRSRSHIANMTRMLGLPEAVLDMVRSGDLSAGHARSLVVLDDPMPVAKKVAAETMSVRALERYIQSMNDKRQDSLDKANVEANSLPVTPGKSVEVLSAENDVSNYLGMRFSIESKDITKGGYVRVDFKNMDQLNDLIDLLREQKTGLHAPHKTLLD